MATHTWSKRLSSIPHACRPYYSRGHTALHARVVNLTAADKYTGRTSEGVKCCRPALTHPLCTPLPLWVKWPAQWAQGGGDTAQPTRLGSAWGGYKEVTRPQSTKRDKCQSLTAHTCDTSTVTLEPLQSCANSLTPGHLTSSNSSAGFNDPEHMRNYPMILLWLGWTTLKSPMVLFPSITRYFKQFNSVELPRTHEIFSYDPCSLNLMVVQAIQQGWTSPNSRSVLLWSLVPQLLSISSSFPGWNNLNSLNIVLWSFFPQLLSSSSCSAGLNYTPNSWNVLLWSFFPQLLGRSSSSAGLNYIELMKRTPMILVLVITQYFEQFG